MKRADDTIFFKLLSTKKAKESAFQYSFFSKYGDPTAVKG